MIFSETRLPGAYIIEHEPISDERGFFAVSWSVPEFQKRGLNTVIAQTSLAFNPRKGTLRGMHFQIAPHAEVKLVRCTSGALYDVIIDLRPESPTFKQWVGVELTASSRRMVYIPERFAHGYLTLADNTESCYQLSALYHPELARGVRWDDPAFGIEWPGEVNLINERDRTYPDFTP